MAKRRTPRQTTIHLRPQKPEGPIRAAALSAPAPILVEPKSFSEVTDVKKRAYLSALVQHHWQIGVASKAVGISPRTTLYWKRNLDDTAYQQALEDAHALFCEWCEGELSRRGFVGVERPVFQQGRLVGTVREFDTIAAIFRLKGEMPEKYREVQEQRHTGPGGGPVQVQSVTLDLSKLTSEQLEAYRAAIEILESARSLPAASSK